jgi:hypothetical protein
MMFPRFLFPAGKPGDHFLLNGLLTAHQVHEGFWGPIQSQHPEQACIRFVGIHDNDMFALPLEALRQEGHNVALAASALSANTYLHVTV